MDKTDQKNSTIAYPTPPQAEAYLPAAIQKAVVRIGVQHPLTIYPIALGISAGVVGALFNIPLLLTAAVAAVLMGPVWAISQVFFRNEALGSQYLESLHFRQQKYEAHLVDKIESGLETCVRTKELARTAATGIAQLKSIQVKLANVKELLEMKLQPNEITYGRFLGAAEQVSLSVMDNLNTVVGLLKSTTSIEPDYIHARLHEIANKSNLSREDEAQRNSLQERLDLWRQQLDKVNQLMAKNEAAMTEMEHISAAVAQWQPDRKFAAGDFEDAIKQLHALALQAQDYEKL